MTLTRPFSKDVSNDCIMVAEQIFEKAIRAVAQTTQKIESEELEALAEYKAVAQNATQATKLLLQEVGRVHELRKRKSGVVYDYAIDLDAARVEIGRRLACLRAARGD